MTEREALKLALEALEAAYARLVTKCEQNLVTYNGVDVDTLTISQEAITAIKEALALQEHDYKDLYEKEKRKSAMWLAKYEEVAGPAPTAIPMAQPEQDGKCKYCTDGCPACDARKLPERTWVGLTDDEQQQAYEQWQNDGWGVFYNAIEAKLKEKNT